MPFKPPFNPTAAQQVYFMKKFFSKSLLYKVHDPGTKNAHNPFAAKHIMYTHDTHIHTHAPPT